MLAVLKGDVLDAWGPISTEVTYASQRVHGTT